MNRNCFFAFLVVMGCCQAWAATRTVTLDALPAIELVREGETASLRAEGLERPLEPVGAPSLPYYTVSLEVAAGAEVGAITLEGAWQTLAEGVTLEPIQPVYVISETPETVGPDPALYAKAWPEAAVENLGITRSLGKRTLHLKVTPVRYAGGKVEVLTQGSVSVEVTEPAAVPRLMSASLLTAEAKATTPPARRYILISPPAYTTRWQAYIEARRTQRPDVTFVLKNAAEIYSAYPFNPNNTDGSPRNPAESIHQFLREDVAANPAGTTYVVLGGSWVNAWNITSADDTTLQTKIPGVIAKPVAVVNEYPLTDMFYACLDVNAGKYPWDSNANKTYADSGEQNSSNDYYADIVVSRIPLRSTKLSEADVITAFKAKVAHVEGEAFTGRHRYYSAGAQLTTSYTAANGNFLRGEQTFYDGGLNQFDPTRSSNFVDCEVVPRLTLKNILSARRPVLGGNPLFPYSWSAAYATQGEATNDFFSKDREYTEYRDHGSSTYLYGGLVTADRHLSGTGISRIILAGYSCMTGCIDSNKVTLAESEIVSQRGGTVASVHNSRAGLTYANRGSSYEDNGLSSSLQHAIKLQLMNNDCDIGTAWLRSRQRYSSSTGQGRFVVMEQLLLGDPLIALPPAVTATTLTESPTLTADTGYTTLSMPGGTNITSSHLVKVMRGLTVTGAGDFTFAADGGVGSGVTFSTAGDHTLTLASPSKGYFAQPTGATAVAITGSGITLDLGSTAPTFTKLTLNGGESETPKTGNIIRGTTEGQLTRFLPLTVENTEVLFATRDAFLRKANDVVQTVATDKITVTNGTVGFLTNPNVGSQYGLWDGFYCPVELNNGTIHVKATQTAAFGHSAKPGLAVSVTGTSAVKTTGGGKITLFGTSTFTVAQDATLDLAAAFATSTTADSKLVINNSGKVTVADATGLAGEVTVNGGTLQLTAIPLANVTKLTLTGDVKLILPKDEGGFYQILPVQDSTLEKTGTVTVYTADDTATAISGEFTTTNAFFDKTAFLTWNTASGNWNTTDANWLRNGTAATYSAGDKAYFPDINNGAAVTVSLPSEVACDFVNFGNAASTYTFAGERLSVKNLQLGTPVTFSNTVYSSGGVVANGGKTAFADLTTPTLDIASGATVSASILSNTISTIKGIRFYPLAAKNGTTCAISELEFYNTNGKVTIPSNHSEPTDVATSSNWDALSDGRITGLQFDLGSREYVWSVTVPDVSDFTNGRYYMQFNFASAIPIITSYKVGAPYNDQNTKSLKNFRVDVTSDGISWVTVSTVTNASVPGAGFGALWQNSGNPFTCSNGGPTAVTVSAGGAYGLKGTPNAKITCEAGAIFKAVSGSALQYNANCTFVYPEAGTIEIDPTALGLAANGKAQVIANNGKTFTHADLAHFSVPEGYNLERDSNGLNVVKQSTLAGPYRRTLNGRANWAETGWTADTATEGGTWSSANRQPCADIELLTTADTVLKIEGSVSFGTLRQQVLPVLPEGTEGSGVDRSTYANRLRLEKSAGATVEAVTYDLSAFEGRVTIAFSTGAATVIAGADTRLRESGTGKLVIGEGMKVTLYAARWGGTIENNGGTIEYRAPMKAPQVQFK